METTSKNAQTITRQWHDLKPGDTVKFAGKWHEIFDAYPIAKNTVIVKLIIRGPKAASRIETHRVRVNAGSKATCKA